MSTLTRLPKWQGLQKATESPEIAKFAKVLGSAETAKMARNAVNAGIAGKTMIAWKASFPEISSYAKSAQIFEIA